MAGQYPAHEGLQYSPPDRTYNAPEVYHYHESAPEVAPKSYASPEKAPPHQEQHLLVPDQPKRWCGVPKRRALIIGSVILLVIIGAVVGGVVGALVARNGTSNSNNASDSSSASATAAPSTTSDAPVTSAATTTSLASTASTRATSTSASTSSAFPTPSNNILSLNCPAINNTQFTVDSSSFEVYCLTDFRSGSGNIAQSLEPSINDCIGSCVTYNTENDNTDSPCQGLTFGANLTRYGGANCFLKTGPLTRVPYTIDDYQAGAILLG
ncbi:hypothetical protein KVR01_004850 [Diaporthe batatas]|uniref:uncharacterized protein n=1 Tax=Diaporthe batatas TaxID=748121 RepID=UPI001D03A4A7|nr:uncharacterized protein KVR01_004850 [Diaporthe batatas]KAG8164575.1 hypothetical protein KVR01_004850 [Diaporthe batatas]